jgi:hypothetical protein
MELEIYLKDQYEDYIYICQRCSKIVLTVSYTCLWFGYKLIVRASNASMTHVSYVSCRAEES